MASMAVAPLSDGRLQFSMVGSQDRLVTAWKTSTDSNSVWDGLHLFNPSPGRVREVTVGRLPDGRLQLWAEATDGRLLTCWKGDRDSGSPWTVWGTAFPLAVGP